MIHHLLIVASEKLCDGFDGFHPICKDRVCTVKEWDRMSEDYGMRNNQRKSWHESATKTVSSPAQIFERLSSGGQGVEIHCTHMALKLYTFTKQTKLSELPQCLTEGWGWHNFYKKMLF